MFVNVLINKKFKSKHIYVILSERIMLTCYETEYIIYENSNYIKSIKNDIKENKSLDLYEFIF